MEAQSTLRILIYTNHYFPENFRINELAEHLALVGHDVSVVTGIPNYPTGRIHYGYGLFKRLLETHNGVQIKRIPLIPRGDGSALMLILNYMSSLFSSLCHLPYTVWKKPDLILVFSTSPATVAIPAVLTKKFTNAKLFTWVLDLWPESLSATGAVKNKGILKTVGIVVRWIYRNSDEILVSSSGFSSKISELMKCNRKCVYFPNWIEKSVTESLPGEEKVPELKGSFKILFTGNVGAAQDFPTIVKAARLLRDYKGIHWHIVGDGRYQEILRKEVIEYGLESNFHLHGRFPPNAMQDLFDQASVLLLPLRNEEIFSLTAPGKLQTYMNSGKPILASIAGEAAQIVEQAHCGLVSPPGSPEHLSENTMRFVEMSDKERNQLGMNGVKFCNENFTTGILFKKFDDLVTTCFSAG